MAVGAQGSNVKVLHRTETTAGVAATGNYDQLPFYAFDLAGSQEMQADQVLGTGAGRDASDPYLDVLTVRGSARVPVDLVNFGRWLRLLLGAPATTGTTDFTHVFESGATTLPTSTFEKAIPDANAGAGLFQQYEGVHGGSLQMDFAPSGAADATVQLVGLSENKLVSSGGGTPVIAPNYQRFLKAQASITKDGTPLGLVTGGGFTFTNNVGEVRTIRSDNRLEGVDVGLASAEGTLTVRLSADQFLDQSISFTPSPLSYIYTISATKALTFAFPRVFFSRPGIPINGPLGIEQQVRWRASNNGAVAALMTVTLKNQTAVY